MASLFAPVRHSYRYLQRQAHEQPVIFFSCIIGLAGPVLLVAVPPLRERLGYKAIERPPTTYPRAYILFSMTSDEADSTSVPKRARVPVTGYEDE
ncbi:hypothetical protein NM688_g1037 [Phlebia brevispora]|uniref:Uncharacterized protein n=1 Tax=Phlebia brevispora TaxID=194682 RepID=A0ACC1TCL5_9APHY|nr:hypothetical protein NM688_g1037 [Phlebia brevispora]